MIDSAVTYIGCVVALIAVLKLLWNWRSDYIFYKANNWDYSKDSGNKLYYGYSRSGGLMSNRDRVTWGYGAAIILFLIVGAAFFAFAMKFLE